MKPMSAGEILEELVDKHSLPTDKRNAKLYEEILFLQALQSLYSLLEEGMPKEIDMGYTGDHTIDLLRDVRNEYGVGYNQALTEIKQVLKEMLLGKEE
jgi:hypothetical protein